MKTISLKKVSAVAVASLGFGLLSVVPANADAVTAAGIVEKISLAKVTSTPVTGAAVETNLGLVVGALTGEADGDTLNIRGYLSSYPAGAFAQVAASATAVGTDSEIGVDVKSDDNASGSSYIVTFTDSSEMGAGETVTATSAVGIGKYSFTPSAVGTYVLTVWADSDGDTLIDLTEAVQTISITVVAPAGLSAGTSSAFIIAGNGTTAPSSTSDALPIAISRTLAGTNAAAIEVIAKDTDNGNYTSVTLSATMTGPGYLDWRSGDAAPNAGRCSATPTYSATVGRTISSQSADALGELYVCADGVAGASTVTVTLTDTVSKVATQIGSTKNITFFGAVAKLELVKSVWTNIRAGGFWQDGADADTEGELQALSATVTQSVTIKMTDSGGRVANSAATPTVLSDNTAITAQGVCGLDDGNATHGSGGTGFYNCGFQSATSSKSGDKSTVTIRIVDPADATKFLTVTAALTYAGSVATEVLSVDKTSYAAGEAMVVTITAKDSAGNPAFDGAASVGAIVANKSAIGLPSAASFYAKGVKTYGATGGVYAPALPGAFILTATGTSTAAPTITASSSVTDTSTAVNTRIDSLNAKIVALTALIAKIMKSLKIK